MYSNTAPSYAYAGQQGWFARSENWLDNHGRKGWIGATVLGFIAFWPVGLGLLGYSLMSGKYAPSERMTKYGRGPRGRMPSVMRNAQTGNAAFDAYKAETLQRLQDEQADFEGFLERLREAKDKAEFDQFMKERSDDSQSTTD